MDQPAASRARDVDTIRNALVSAVNLQEVVGGTDLANTVSSDRDVADERFF